MKTEFIAFLQQYIGHQVGERIPGLGGWLNARLRSVADNGDLELEFDIRPEMLNPLGTIHGGAVAAILDEAMGMQNYIKSAEGDAFFALNIVVDFVKNAKLGEVLIAKPELIRQGRTTANLRCVLTNTDGVIIAHASSNFIKIMS